MTPHIFWKSSLSLYQQLFLRQIETFLDMMYERTTAQTADSRLLHLYDMGFITSHNKETQSVSSVFLFQREKERFGRLACCCLVTEVNRPGPGLGYTLSVLTPRPDPDFRNSPVICCNRIYPLRLRVCREPCSQKDEQREMRTSSL